MERLKGLLEGLSGPQIALFAFLLASPSLLCGYNTDDFLHAAAFAWGHPPFDSLFGFTRLFDLAREGESDFLLALRDRGSLPWLADPDLKLAFFRPLAGLTHALDDYIARGSPALAHLHSTLWYALCALAALRAYRRLAPGPWAALAALLWVVNDEHAFAAGWIASRNALMCTAFGFVALERFAAGRSLAAALAMAAAMCSGEASVSVYSYLLAYLVFLDERPLHKRALAALPIASVALVWLLVWVGAGYGTSGTGMYIDPTTHPARWLGAAMIRWPVLASAALVGPLSMLQPLARVDLAPLFGAGSLLSVAFVLALLRRCVPLDKTSAFLLAGALLSLVPFVGTAPGGRMLLIPALGVAGIVARALLSGAGRAEKAVLWGLHAALPAISFVPSLFATASTDAIIVDPLTEEVFGEAPGRDVVLVNAPSLFFASYAPAVLGVEGRPVPPHFRVIAPSWQAIEVERIDPNTLVVRPEVGWSVPVGTSLPGEPLFSMSYLLQTVDTVVRSRPLEQGERIVLPGVEIEILERASDGALSARWRFDEPLEGLSWGRWSSGRYVPWSPPEVGRSARIEAEPL